MMLHQGLDLMIRLRYVRSLCKMLMTVKEMKFYQSMLEVSGFICSWLSRILTWTLLWLRDFHQGSRIIFAGPHKSFCNVTPMSNAVFFMRKRIEEDLEVDLEERSFSIVTNKFIGTTVELILSLSVISLTAMVYSLTNLKILGMMMIIY